MRVLSRLGEKALGLLGSGPDAEPVLLTGCRSIHTVGMRYPIDVAFISRSGLVLKVVRSMAPGGAARCRGAYAVLERPASGNAWVEPGDALALGVRKRSSRGEELPWMAI